MPVKAAAVAAPPKEKTLWQKIVAFFQFGKTTNGTGGHGPRAAAKATGQTRGGGAAPAHRVETASFRPARKPEAVEVTSPKLYVGNLSFDATESDLFDLFKGVGKVLNAEIVSHKHTQKSKGFAFVVMQSLDEARRAVTELHDKEFMGRKLVVSGAKTNDSPRGVSSSGSDAGNADERNGGVVADHRDNPGGSV